MKTIENHPRITGIGTANQPPRLTQEQSFWASDYEDEHIRKIFLNSDIDFRHFYFEGSLNRNESSDEPISATCMAQEPRIVQLESAVR